MSCTHPIKIESKIKQFLCKSFGSVNLKMETNLQHEDLLMKVRVKLNEEKIKLWESPYNAPDFEISQELEILSKRYSTLISEDQQSVLSALRELQLLSIEHTKANAQYKETGVATVRVKLTVSGKTREVKVPKTLDAPGEELIAAVAVEAGVAESRIKLIFNGKVLKPTPSIGTQGVKNGSQIMALIMTETPEEVQKQDTMYKEMKSTRDDAMLLSECPDDIADDDEYMKLEDQSGKTVELPGRERRSLMVGLALHSRGRAAAKKKDYAMALVLLLEADSQFRECNSAILEKVDNWAVLQLDISWCYLALRSLRAANDAAPRLQAAEKALKNSYGEKHTRVEALKGTAANERVIIMRLYLLQGIVAYHQNKRDDARRLLEKAEVELNALRVDDTSVAALVELGWSPGSARAGLRARCGDVTQAHHYLEQARMDRHNARELHRDSRQRRLLGICMDGSNVKPQLVEALISMGYSKTLATVALRNSNNNVADAVRIIQEEPEMLADSDISSDEVESSESNESMLEPDNKLVAELEAMGYITEEAKTALKLSRNQIAKAVDLLIAGGGHVDDVADPSNPSTSTSAGTAKKRQKTAKKDKRRREREAALKRLSEGIRHDEDDHLDSSLVEEEEYLVQYKSLL